jgi:hypothetical protein
MNTNTTMENCERYIIFHRLHILAILFVVFFEVGRYTGSPFIGHVFVVFLFLYLFIPKKMDVIFQCSEQLYVTTFYITGFMFAGITVGVIKKYELLQSIFSEYTIYISIFVLLNSIFMMARLKGMGVIEFIENDIRKTKEK